VSNTKTGRKQDGSYCSSQAAVLPQSTVFKSGDAGYSCFLSSKSKAAPPHASLVECLSGEMLHEWRCSRSVFLSSKHRVA